MSFFADVRSELLRIINEEKCCGKAELAALLINKSSIEKLDQNYNMSVETEDPATARKIYKLLKDILGFKSTVKIIDKTDSRKNRGYIVNTILTPLEFAHLNEIVTVKNNKITPLFNGVYSRKCCQRAYLRGLFLSRGFISSPEGSYHLELIVDHPRLAEDVQGMLKGFGVDAKIIARKKSLVLYVKESEKIGDFLRIVGAYQALLKFEDIRILKSMRNSVNRHVNCETANLVKTINASVRQTELIKKLKKHRGLDSLPYKFRSLAILRLENPESALKELGEMLDPPLSKSGVAYRMKRLEKIAEEMLEESE
ncbi:MAG TPA: DNA-binding protein WhiA [Syntrophomonadaceae bacterium]|nr:DNA-binding protein WhiA [Syntrophomonadaceae bacterium]